MRGLIEFCFSRSRMTILSLVFLCIIGLFSYKNVPKESSPDVAIPFIYVAVTLEGISPEDAERLLIRPLETELSNLKGLKEMRSIASEGHGSVILEFSAGFESEKAYRDVQDKVDQAVQKLPASADKPIVKEINVALFPIINVLLAGPLPEREMLLIARDLKTRLENVSGVLEVKIAGDREDLLEVIVDLSVLETYQLTLFDVINLINSNNQLIAAGSLEGEQGKLTLKIPGTIETLDDFLGTPVKVSVTETGTKVVTLGDIAKVQRSYKDPTSLARLNGQPAIALEISKRIGANIIETVAGVKAAVAEVQAHWPNSVQVEFQQDQGKQIEEMVLDLENNVIAAVLIVMIIMVATLGTRSALLVSIAIPGSFLIGIFVIDLMGYSLNMITLFSLILVVGMLVDDAVVVSELADRKMVEGLAPRAAYKYATMRMFWPITSATLTKIVVFLPLIFWPGIAGDFMKYLPITVMVTLAASWIMAIIFLPVLGGIFGKAGSTELKLVANMQMAESGDLDQIGGMLGRYLRFLKPFLYHPWWTLLGTIGLVIVIYVMYGMFGRGVEFFPDVEPDFAQIQIHARGDLSIYEKDKIVRQIENISLAQPPEKSGIKSVYTTVIGQATNDGNSAPDLIGILQIEFTDWQTRRPAREILEALRAEADHIPGVVITVQEPEGGPPSGAPIQIEVAGYDFDVLKQSVEHIRGILEGLGTLHDITDNRPLDGIEWQLKVDRAEAAKFGVSIATLGSTVQMLTRGVTLAKYRPFDVTDEVDVRARLPIEDRHLDILGSMTIGTDAGQMPLRNFVSLVPVPALSVINRTNGLRTFKVEANLKPDVLADTELQRALSILKDNPLPEGAVLKLKGADQDQRESMEFLIKAFFIAMFLMVIVLVTEFNSFYQTLLVMSAIVISTAGVLLGMLITNQAFSIVMGGIGVISLAGIVVNNNIVLIDAYNQIRATGQDPVQSVLRACAQRLRPVLLTSATTVLGLMPMVLQITLNLFDREVSVGAPSTQFWTQLSSSIAGGMTFATLLTLVVTPCLLVGGEQIMGFFRDEKK